PGGAGCRVLGRPRDLAEPIRLRARRRREQHQDGDSGQRGEQAGSAGRSVHGRIISGGGAARSCPMLPRHWGRGQPQSRPSEEHRRGQRQVPLPASVAGIYWANQNEEETMADNGWHFVHNLASEAKWTPGLREIFEYRDLGIKDGTKGDFVAHLIRHNGRKMKDEVQKWHVHDCTFQFVLVMNGWATFEYEGQGQRTIRKGDAILQVPGIKHREIACSEDFEVLEIVSPANFATRVVEAPAEKAQAAE